jgi:hypothetical protein
VKNSTHMKEDGMTNADENEAEEEPPIELD